jgi:hypothetical protein
VGVIYPRIIMLTDLVFLNDLSIDEIMSTHDYEVGVWYSSRNIDMIPLSALGEMLNVADYNSLMAAFVMASEPAEKMLFSFPEDLQSKLKSISNIEIDSVVNKWSKIEEFNNLMSSDTCKQYLTEVREFLNKSDASVYLVMGI